MSAADTGIRRVTSLAGDPAWLVTRYDDVKALLADQRLGRSHPHPERASRVSSSSILGGPTGDDPAAEDAERVRMRRLVGPAFSARRMAALQPLSGDRRISRAYSRSARTIHMRFPRAKARYFQATVPMNASSMRWPTPIASSDASTTGTCVKNARAERCS